jgi:hypothetical protein
MKKTFTLINEKIKRDRLIESARRDIKKYIKREQNKPLTEGVDFWDFNCRFGHTEEEARTIHISEIKKCIDEIQDLNLESFYMEILSKPGKRTKKPESAES